MRSLAFVFASSLLAVACSSKESSPDAPRAIDTPVAAIDAPPNTPDAPPADAKTGFTLHLTNALNWCDVTVDGTKFTASAPADKSYAKDTVVHLHADPTPNGTGGSNFIWGYWTGTDAVSGTTHDTAQDATVTMSADKTVYVCCPFPNGTGC